MNLAPLCASEIVLFNSTFVSTKSDAGEPESSSYSSLSASDLVETKVRWRFGSCYIFGAVGGANLLSYVDTLSYSTTLKTMEDHFVA